MPHCVIEYSEELGNEVESEHLMYLVYQGALSTYLFEPEDIKIRAIPFEYCPSGSIKQNFIHVTVKILSGRNLEQRTKLSESVLFELRKISLSSVSLTVDIYEIEKTSYAKVVR